MDTIAPFQTQSVERDEIVDALVQQWQESGASMILAKAGLVYSPQVRLMFMHLIRNKVPFESIPRVIDSVLSLAGKSLSDTPSERTVRRIAGGEILSLKLTLRTSWGTFQEI